MINSVAKRFLIDRIQYHKAQVKSLTKIQSDIIKLPGYTSIGQVRMHFDVKQDSKRFDFTWDQLRRLNLKAKTVFELFNIISKAIDLHLEQIEFNLNTWKVLESEDHPSRSAAAAYIAKQIQAVTKLISKLESVLADLDEDIREPVEVPRPVHFIKNNKLPAPDDDEHKRVRLPILMAEELANTLNLIDKEMATLLTISIRTYHRLKLNGLLNPVASERLTLLKELAEYGLEVFEDQASFNEWLRSPLRELNNKSPLNSLDTATGINLIKTILGRIDYGVYS